MNELPYELQQIEAKLAKLVPEPDSARDAELLRFFQRTQPVVAPNLAEELARAKRQSFWLGGTLGLCVGAMAMFLAVSVFYAEIPKEPVAAPAPLESPGVKLTASLETLQPLPTAVSADVIPHLLPPPSAFWIPFSLAALLVMSVLLLSRHLRVRVVL